MSSSIAPKTYGTTPVAAASIEALLADPGSKGKCEMGVEIDWRQCPKDHLPLVPDLDYLQCVIAVNFS